MGLLSLSNLAICIKKAEFFFESLKNNFKGDPKFNLGQLKAYKLMCAIHKIINGKKKGEFFWLLDFWLHSQ